MASRGNYGAFKRIFQDNISYAKFDEIPFVEPLAQVVESYLYTEKAENNDDDWSQGYRMSEHIELYDFMSLAVYFIGAASTKHIRATIDGYIRNLSFKTGNFLSGMKVHYNDDTFWITDCYSQVHIALLWVTFIYCNVRSCESSNSEFWRNSTKIVHELLKEHIGLNENALKKDLLYKQTGEAIKLMGKYVIEELEPLAEELGKESKATNTTQVSDISELMNENESLKAHIAKLVDENKQLKAETDDLRDALRVYESSSDIEWHAKVRLELAMKLIEKADANLAIHGNKARASRLLQTLTNLPKSTCGNYVTNRDLNTEIHSDEVLKLNSSLQALGIEIRL